MKKIRVACIGAGYFAGFHLEAWKRIPEVDLVALCDLDVEKAGVLADIHHIPKVYGQVEALFDAEEFDVIDIITPPQTHAEICRVAITRKIDIICQKPLAPTIAEAEEMVAAAEAAGIRFMVHENFRFQPWYRQIKRFMEQGAIGEQLHSFYFRMRMGDGWPEDAYLSRQPYFRTMPRLLIYETGIHFIDVFRFLGGEIEGVFADLRRLNPHIAGEDAGMLFFYFANGGRGTLDANRYNEPNSDNARYTFGEMLVEGNAGSIRLYLDGSVTLQRLGEKEEDLPYTHQNKNFAGDCVYFTQRHFVDSLLHNLPFENNGRAYLQNLLVQEAVYESARTRRLIQL